MALYRQIQITAMWINVNHNICEYSHNTFTPYAPQTKESSIDLDQNKSFWQHMRSAWLPCTLTMTNRKQCAIQWEKIVFITVVLNPPYSNSFYYKLASEASTLTWNCPIRGGGHVKTTDPDNYLTRCTTPPGSLKKCNTVISSRITLRWRVTKGTHMHWICDSVAN